MADERFAATCRFFIPLLSPPDKTMGGRRGIPAIGDHESTRHPIGFLFGWLAKMAPQEHQSYQWAWREVGSETDAHSPQAQVFSPLLLPEPEPAKPPALPALITLPGYGAAARYGFNTERESLLVIRCGPSWGHYHFDQSSFWWYWNGLPICADAGLGSGPLKSMHEGHNVLGFPGFTPMQFLDRVPFEIDRAEQAGDEFVFRCQVPVRSWYAQRAFDKPIDSANRPHITRTFRWSAPDRLSITDEPRNSPEGLVQWHLHVLAESAERVGDRTVRFVLPENSGELHVTLPTAPSDLQLAPTDKTTHLQCTYHEGVLTHELVAVR
jgi:hypothetical protein